MTNEEYYIRSTVQKKQVICDMYVVNDGCIDYEAVQKWLKEEHKYDA